jgi:pepF/M3 family oligoendopeptidase
MTLKASRMDKETLDAMMTAIKEYLPNFRSYLKKKAEMLGHKQGLPFYDLFAPIGQVEMTYTYDEARDYVIKNFSSYSSKLGQYAKNAFDKDWIDPDPREGKVSGAFCSNIHSKKESRIMANFNGSFNDVSTLAHELGHGYHGDCLSNVKPSNSDYPMPLAETASIFCETIVTNAALKDATKEEALVITENSVMSANQVIVDIYSRYLFETALLENRKSSSISVDELKTLMTNAQLEAYGDGLDPEYLHPYMWVCKPHYYSAQYNFYNFPYAFGLLFAKGLYAMYLEEGESFLPKYDALLEATGDHDIKDVLAIVGVDSHNPDFFRASLDLIAKEIEFIVSY